MIKRDPYFHRTTYCKFFKTCSKGDTCPQALTIPILMAADKWWGFNPGRPPIKQYIKPPECYDIETLN